MKLREAIEQNASELCAQFGIKRLCVFGSVARGDESAESDIDFLAEFYSPTPESMPDRYFGFIDAASKLFERPIQLLTPRMLRNSHLIRSVEKDMLVVYQGVEFHRRNRRLINRFRQRGQAACLRSTIAQRKSSRDAQCSSQIQSRLPRTGTERSVRLRVGTEVQEVLRRLIFF